MRAIALKSAGLLLFIAASMLAGEPSDTLIQLASALSQHDALGAVSLFDPRMPGFGAVESDIGASTSQTDVLCAIEVLEEKDYGAERELNTDWYLQLKSQSPAGSIERRRQNVIVRMKLIGGKWKIIALSPPGILAPLRVK